jgi:tetratricopeptide (TPR) repeat protein
MVLADAHDRMGLLEERAHHWPFALREHQAALAIRTRIPQSTAADFALARTYVAIGDCMYVGEFQIPKSLLTPPQEWYERSLQVLARIPANANRAQLLRDIGRANQHLGSAWSHKPVDFKRALLDHDAALRALEECMRLTPDDASARRNFADQLAMKATAQNAIGDVDGVIAGMQRALPILADLGAADPKNSEAQHDLAFAHEQLALAYLRAKRYAEARHEADQVLAIRQKLVAADARNREDRRDMMRTYGILVEIEKAAGHDATAAELQAKSRAISRELGR